MAAYLSAEWQRDFDAAVRADAGLRDACREVRLILQYEVAEAVGEPVVYAVRFEPDGPSVHPGAAADADIVFRADRATATSIAQGSASAQRAVIDGRLTIAGSTTALLGQADLLATLSSVLESLRANTTWP